MSKKANKIKWDESTMDLTARYDKLVTAGTEILDALEVEHQGVEETPQRYAHALMELLRGYQDDPKKYIKVFDNVKTSSMIVMDTEFFSMCEHHMLPFFGKAFVGYIPRNDKVLGASKLARIFDAFACQLQVQERIGEQFCDFLVKHLNPIGVVCYIQAVHLCITGRGVKKQSHFKTCALRGVFKDDEKARAEFFQIVNIPT